MMLFVYGTLRPSSAHPMARHLAGRARYVGSATVAGRLYDLGRYPGLLEGVTGSDCVQGDVYDLADDEELLRALDAYENGESPHPAFFERCVATIKLKDGREIEAWIYWFRGEVCEEQHIASGCWQR